MQRLAESFEALAKSLPHFRRCSQKNPKPKNLPYQRHSSSTDCTRELVKPTKDSASLLSAMKKTFFG